MAKDRFQLQPIINEIVRTRVCPNRATLLVDRISIIHSTKSSRNREDQAFRMWLSDGYKSIQGILKHELHPYLAAGQICEGSYVELSNCELTAAKRLHGDGFVDVLQIVDLRAVGHDGREALPFQYIDNRPGSSGSLPKSSAPAPPAASPSRSIDLDIESPGRLSQMLRESQMDLRKTPAGENDPGADEASFVPACRTRSMRKRIEEPVPPESPTRPKRKREITSSPLEAINDNRLLRPRKVVKTEANVSPTKPPETPVVKEKDITRPLAITPLARLTGPRTVRNKIHDVLAVISSVDDQVIRRRGMPEQRNLRITDQSTTKHVQLTVFVNAAQFKPAVGTVALFRNVTTHEWNGGSLKAYQRDCAGVKWFFPEPKNVDPKMLSLLRHCWGSRKAADDARAREKPPTTV